MTASEQVVYLDNHSTTAVSPNVVAAMLPFLSEHYGNPGSRTHVIGQHAAAAVEHARNQVATLVGYLPEDVIFTSGATEANNLALFGLVAGSGQHIVTAATEHKSVLDPIDALRARGAAVTVVPVDGDGQVDPADVERAIRTDTAVVSVMWANNETGVINDVSAIARVCARAGVLFHCDGTQGVGKVPTHKLADKPDMMALSAHKMHGPKGIGALVARRSARLRLKAIIRGGGQERGYRSGTLAAHQIVGLGEACSEYLRADKAETLGRLEKLTQRFCAVLDRHGIEYEWNGTRESRLPGSLNLWFKGCDNEALALTARSVAFSTGSACTSAAMEPSHVLMAIYGDETRASESARFCFGRFNTPGDAEFAADAIASAIRKLLAIRSPHRNTLR